MAKKYGSEKEEMFVVAFNSRPTLHVRPKAENNERGQRSMSFTFSDAISRYGVDLVEEDLIDAYKRAGVAFKGQLQQNFVMLHEKQKSGPVKRMSSWEIGRDERRTQKRPRVVEGHGQGDPKKDKKAKDSAKV
jgi:hypothetical protein